MGSFGVVVSDPGADQFAGMGQVAEQRLVKKLVAQPAVEASHKAVRHRLSGGDVVPFDLLLRAQLQDRVRGQLRPVVADDHRRPAAAFNQGRQFPDDTAARDGRVRDCRKGHSRVTSSNTFSTRNRRPQANWSCTKSSDQRALARASIRIGALVPFEI